MKVNRDDLLWFMKSIRHRNNDLTDIELINELATYMEINPSCIDMRGTNKRGRYSYSTVGYGVMSLLGEKYRMGRIEVFDREDESGYQVHEGMYTMPFESANQFEDFIESIETDLPINIEIGSHKWCEEECAKSLGFEDAEEMNNPIKVDQYRKKKNDEFAIKQGFKDWEDLLTNSKWMKKKQE